MDYNFSNSNRRRNNNAVYAILLIVSLVAIIIVAGIFLITEIKKKNSGQDINTTSGAYVTEVYPTQPVVTQGNVSQTTPFVPVETAPVETAPVETVPVQTVSEYDLNGDGVAEIVNVVVDNGNSQAVIGVGNLGTLSISLEPIGVNSFQHLTVAGINLKNEKRLVAIEYTYIDGGMGLIKCHVWSYVNGAFVKNSEILYSGLIGNQGYMDSGVIENRVPEDTFGYVAEENKNAYIYERSRVIADMKDLGIKLPFETVGQYTIGYDRNVTFFYDVNLP